MGVDRTDYIIYGWKFPYMDSEEAEDVHEKLKEGEAFIDDGMCGEYSVFGLQLAEGGHDWEGWNFKELDFKDHKAEDLKKRYYEIFDWIIEGEPLEEPKLFIFSHFY